MDKRLAVWAIMGVMAMGLGTTARGADGAWRDIAEPLQPLTALLDARSPVMGHERYIQPGESMTVTGRDIRFEQQGEQWSAVVDPDGQATRYDIAAHADHPELLTLGEGEERYGLSITATADRTRLRAASAMGIAINVGHLTGYLVDSDLNGELDGNGDGLIVPNTKTVGPLTDDAQAWSLHDAIEIRLTDDGRWQTAVLAMPGRDADHARAWRFLQWHRQAAGLLPLAYDAALEPPMLEHARYIKRNRTYTHRQQPDRPGYTADGARAGMTSNIGGLKANHFEGIASQLLTLFHRRGCLAPELRASAMIHFDDVFMVSVLAKTDSALRDKPLVYPAHGMTNVVCEFAVASEYPRPDVNAGVSNRLGTPISVYFRQWR